jgi:hypothetical protein
MPKEVIARVDQLGRAEGQPKLLTFYNRKGQLIGEHTKYDDVQPDTHIPGAHHVVPLDHEIPGVPQDVPDGDPENTGVDEPLENQPDFEQEIEGNDPLVQE